MWRLFGTDGIRGVANSEPMTVDMALKVGQAVGYLFRRRGNHSRILIGKDTRLSGYMLENAIASGINSMGTDVIFVGPLPTPGIAFITENMDADCGIVISASHNPFEDNGIKIFTPEGIKLTDDQEKEMEELIFSNKLPTLFSPPEYIVIYYFGIDYYLPIYFRAFLPAILPELVAKLDDRPDEFPIL